MFVRRWSGCLLYLGMTEAELMKFHLQKHLLMQLSKGQEEVGSIEPKRAEL